MNNKKFACHFMIWFRSSVLPFFKWKVQILIYAKLALKYFSS